MVGHQALRRLLSRRARSTRRAGVGLAGPDQNWSPRWSLKNVGSRRILSPGLLLSQRLACLDLFFFAHHRRRQR